MLQLIAKKVKASGVRKVSQIHLKSEASLQGRGKHIDLRIRTPDVLGEMKTVVTKAGVRVAKVRRGVLVRLHLLKKLAGE